jgi:hypothetical protein
MGYGNVASTAEAPLARQVAYREPHFIDLVRDSGWFTPFRADKIRDMWGQRPAGTTVS